MHIDGRSILRSLAVCGRQARWWLLLAIAAWPALPAASAADADEFKPKREEVFEFTEKPALTRNGDDVDIAFAVKAACDVTVAIENPEGKIVRHLASGVLGPNAPEPFQKNALKQTVRWDGKNDAGKYVDNKPAHKIRVSLGLKAALDRVMNWDPKRRHGRQSPIFQATKDGMLVYDGGSSHDFIELYDHAGEYQRTLYPFPAGKIGKVEGLPTQTMPQDGQTLPRKPTFLQNTFLTSGNDYGYARGDKYRFEAESVNGDAHYGMYGNAATFMAVGGGRIVVGDQYLCRLAEDGSSGGLPFEGPRCALIVSNKAKPVNVPPRSGALSPDGKTLYLTGYNFCYYGRASNDIVTSGAWDAFHCVMKMDLAGDKPPELFAGKAEVGKAGSDDNSFQIPISVAVDAKGRVYVADFLNDRVQVFGADGKLLRKIPVKRPARLSIGAKTQDLFIFSWLVHCKYLNEKPEQIPPKLHRFSNLDDPKAAGVWDLPGDFDGGLRGYLYSGTGLPYDGEVDTSTEPPTVWLSREWSRENVLTRGKIAYHNIELYKPKGNKLEKLRDFDADIKKTLPRPTATRYGRMRLYVNEATGKLYLAEGTTANEKAFKELVEFDPGTGAFKIVPTPFDAEDMCFDMDGLAYFRTMSVVGRFEPQTWREVPWDYGDELKGVCTSSSSDRKTCDLASALALPSNGDWHMGGMAVSPQGSLVVVAGYNKDPEKRTDEKKTAAASTASYVLKMYPGRNINSRAGGVLINVYDRKGKLVGEDLAPGMFDLYGIGMDHAGHLYLLTSSTRMLDGKRYPNPWTGTVVKLDPAQARVFSSGDKGIPLPLNESTQPKRPPDVQHGGTVQWIEGTQWMYGGVGFCGKNTGQGCACHNTRFVLDYFARSFAPEVERYSVAILDSAGNLVLRIGKYGNGDSAGPKSLEPLGGDEVGLLHGAYVATHTDRKLFIADPSNDRILSVNLLYNTEERLSIPADPADNK